MDEPLTGSTDSKIKNPGLDWGISAWIWLLRNFISQEIDAERSRRQIQIVRGLLYSITYKHLTMALVYKMIAVC